MNIALVDSNPVSATLTSHWLKQQPGKNLLFTAVNGQDFLLKLNKQKHVPDMVIADIRMRIMDGCSLAFYLKTHYPNMKLMAFSGYVEPMVLSSAFISGFDAYIAKGDGWENALQEGINKVTNGYCHLDTRLEKEIDTHAFRSILDSREKFWKQISEGEGEGENKLSKREKTFIILNATAMGYKEIAEVMHVDKRTIETMYNRLSKKLQVTSAKDLALFALQSRMAYHGTFGIDAEPQKRTG